MHDLLRIGLTFATSKLWSFSLFLKMVATAAPTTTKVTAADSAVGNAAATTILCLLCWSLSAIPLL
jgi:hypothetical protein